MWKRSRYNQNPCLCNARERGEDGQEGQREAQPIILPISKRSTTTNLTAPANGRMPLGFASCRLDGHSHHNCDHHVQYKAHERCLGLEVVWDLMDGGEGDSVLIHSVHHQGFVASTLTHFLTHCTPRTLYPHSSNPYACSHDADRCAQGPSAYVSTPCHVFWASVALPPFPS